MKTIEMLNTWLSIEVFRVMDSSRIMYVSLLYKKNYFGHVFYVYSAFTSNGPTCLPRLIVISDWKGNYFTWYCLGNSMVTMMTICHDAYTNCYAMKLFLEICEWLIYFGDIDIQYTRCYEWNENLFSLCNVV